MAQDHRTHAAEEATDEEVDEAIDSLLKQNGHRVTNTSWIQAYKKYQCPECGGLHATLTDECTVCGWEPAPPVSETVTPD